MFTYPTKEANDPRAIDQLSVPPTGLPINYASGVWQINYPTLASPVGSQGIGLAFRAPMPTSPINMSNRSILDHMLNQAVLPWPLYPSNLSALSPNRMQAGQRSCAVEAANYQSLGLDKVDNQNHKPDLAVNERNDQSSGQVSNRSCEQNHDLIVSVLSEQIVKQNIVTDVNVTEDTIRVHISPVISYQYARPDCKNPTTVSRYDSDTITVQGLGVQGKAVRYVVEMVRLYYVNDEMKFTVFTASVPGIRSDIKVTDEVVEASMYFIIDRNLSLRVTAEVLDDLYGIETSSSALDRWKAKEANALPSIGQLIQQLNAKKAITQLHLDEYKAKGTKSWELCIKDEHGRLIFSIALKKRDTWHIKVILRWFRILGLKIKIFYCDFWLAYPPAINAIYPKAEIQFDFFHVVQNIHRHLYKDFTTYRKLFKNSNQEQELEKAHKQLHKKLWQNRYLLFTNEENLDDKQRILLDQLIEEHRGTIVEQVVIFRWYLRDIFNNSDSYPEALEKVSTLILDGWAEISTGFGKSINFLQEYFRNMATYLRVPGVQRNSLSESTVRTLRRIERIRQGFKSNEGRTRHLKLLIYRQYLRTAS